MAEKEKENFWEGWAPFGKTLLQAVVLLSIVFVFIGLIGDHIAHSNIGEAIADNSHGENGFVGMMISLIGISASIIVGFQIFNTLEYRHIMKKFEEDAKKLEDKAKELEYSYDKTTEELKKGLDTINEIFKELTNIDRIDGDHARISAYLLGLEGKHIWAMGWIFRARISYYKAYDRDPDKMESYYPQLLQQCVLIETDNIRGFVDKVKHEHPEKWRDEEWKERLMSLISKDNKEKEQGCIVRRAYTDTIDSRIARDVIERRIDIPEEKYQTDVIEGYIALVTALMEPDDCTKAHQGSKFKDKFYEKVNYFNDRNKGKSIPQIFAAMAEAVDRLPE